jgi:hypothetical protein
MTPPRILKRFANWWAAWRPRPLNELLAVDIDAAGVRVTVLDRLEADWNQRFAWQDIERVCFQDAGLSRSDILFVTVRGRAKPVLVLMEARGGPALLGALAERGYFPETVWRKALGDTNGGTHCWPPQAD